MNLKLSYNNLNKRKNGWYINPHKFWSKLLIILMIIIFLLIGILFLFFAYTSSSLDKPAVLGEDLTATRLNTLEKRVKKIEDTVYKRGVSSSQKNTDVIQ